MSKRRNARKSDVLISATPTNVLFVSNSSVLCGVPLEELEEVFFGFDKDCSFIVYPTSKSYSFVIFSNVSRAVEAYDQLMDSKPFKQEKSTGITLAYISKLPENSYNHQSNAKQHVEGLTFLPDFVDEDTECSWISFVDAEKPSISAMKNRRVFHFGYEFNYAENNALVPTKPIPPSLCVLIDKIMAAASVEEAQRPDQVTVNIYEPGQGIPPHVDTHSAFEEPIISLSLLSDVVMEFRDCANSSDTTNVFLPPRSLLVMRGPGRYRFKHGIMSRKYDVNPVDNRLMARQRRISFTFRKVRRRACECPFLEFCDWDRSGKMALPANNSDGKNLETEYVTKVYEQIADHFDETRRSKWTVVNKFLDGLPEYSLVLDAGCGNGKYLIREDTLCKIGCDLSENLVSIAHQKKCTVMRGDALALPIKSKSVDAVISIAVIHHFSTKQRRKQALLEIERVLRVGGQAIVTVWSMEQQGADDHQESAYAKMRKSKLDSEESALEKGVSKLEVHDGRNFKQQDMLVPWNDVNSSRQFLRYYHLFVAGELAELVAELSSCRLISNEYEEGNWAVVFEKVL
uniref:tRNA (carboxymethyluridine(34)-5-O)-methyltransferase n=1 Tax=Ditylenchus dipsaci TaxID=166011 RepID=A0A915CZR0_9BILA